MEDTEIYTLACEVLNTLSQEISEDPTYSGEGKLSISFSTENKEAAWAESFSSVDAPPNHRITITYLLIKQLYHDSENFHFFLDNIDAQPAMKSVLNGFKPKPSLPEGLTKEAFIRNMFIGSLTWIFFHELGHLNQEHGHIRTMFSDSEDRINRITDCATNGHEKLSPRTAAVYQATEFAADVEASLFCIRELNRHFLTPSKKDLASYRNTLFLLTSGISCTLYRFNGVMPIQPYPSPDTSHPTPIRRLEVCIAYIFEHIDLDGEGAKIHGLDRETLVGLCSGAAWAAALSWCLKHNLIRLPPETYIIKGIRQDPYLSSYWKLIVDTWNEIEPEIKKVRRDNSDYSELRILNFTDNFRKLL